MAMKLICGCLLAVAFLGCLTDAQYSQYDKASPQKPQAPPQRPKPPPQRPQQTPQWNHQPPKSPQQGQQWTHQHQQLPPAHHSCEVSDQYKIQCGATTISSSDCEAINCCYDGRMCFYGKSVTVQCTKDAQVIVVVARDATLPNIDLETVHFIAEDPRCTPVGVTSAFAIYQFPVTACGTTLVEESGVLIYENRMSSLFEVAVGPYGIITRDSQYELVLQCRYIGTSVEAVVVEVGVIPAPPPVAAPGPLRVELRLANGQCSSKGCREEDVVYYSFYNDEDYPVTKILRDPVYVEVRMLERTDPNLVLTLGRCWATSNPFPHSLPQWDLLVDGCPYNDDRYRTHLLPVYETSDVLYPTHYRRFVFKMFTFVDSSNAHSPKGGGSPGGKTSAPLNEKVYIHCDTAVCHPSHGYDCQPRCNRKRRNIVASGLGGNRDETTLVSSKELVIINPISIE